MGEAVTEGEPRHGEMKSSLSLSDKKPKGIPRSSSVDWNRASEAATVAVVMLPELSIKMRTLSTPSRSRSQSAYQSDARLLSPSSRFTWSYLASTSDPNCCGRIREELGGKPPGWLGCKTQKGRWG